MRQPNESQIAFYRRALKEGRITRTEFKGFRRAIIAAETERRTVRALAALAAILSN